MLLGRYQRKPEVLCSWIAGRLCAGMVSWMLQQYDLHDTALVRALCPVCEQEFARSAQTLAALQLLGAGAGDPALLIKGAATRHYYPHPHLRQMRDIDAVVSPATFRHMAAGDWVDDRCIHLHPVVMAGVPVEFHQRFTASPRWGRYAQLADGCTAVVDAPQCCQPSPEIAYTISLLHFFQHVGRTTFDLPDMRMIVASGAFNWERAQAIWERHGIWHLVLPGLIVAAHVCEDVPGDVLAQCARYAQRRHRRLLQLFFSAMFSRRMRTLKRVYCESILADIPLLRFCAQRLTGTPGATWVREGVGPGQAGFRWQQYVVAPLRRLRHGLFH